MKRLVLIFCLALLGGILPAQTPVTESSGVIDVTGSAFMDVSPDYASIVIRVEKRSPSAREAQEAVSELMAKVLKYLEQRGDVAEVKTQYVNLHPEYNYQEKMVNNYTANQSLSFDLQNLQAYDELMVELLELGINGISNVQFKSSQEEAIRKSLLGRAVLAAREKALTMTAELGQSVGKAVYISDQLSRSSDPRPYLQAERMESMASGPSIQPGRIRLEIIANVRFKLN